MKTLIFTKTRQVCYLLIFSILLGSCQKQASQNENSTNPLFARAADYRTETDGATECTGTGLNHFISLGAAIKMIDRYQLAVRNGTAAIIYNEAVWVNAETYSGDAIQKILSQPGCCKFRIYNGIGDDKMQHLIIVGTNPAGEDVLYRSLRPAGTANTNAGDDPPPLIVNTGMPCPVVCGGTYITP
jgi:hypothetical protein